MAVQQSKPGGHPSRACHRTTSINQVCLHCTKPLNSDTSHLLMFAPGSTRIDHEQQHLSSHVVLFRLPGIVRDICTENPLNIGRHCRHDIHHRSSPFIARDARVGACCRQDFRARCRRSRRTDLGHAGGAHVELISAKSQALGCRRS